MRYSTPFSGRKAPTKRMRMGLPRQVSSPLEELVLGYRGGYGDDGSWRAEEIAQFVAAAEEGRFGQPAAEYSCREPIVPRIDERQGVVQPACDADRF